MQGENTNMRKDDVVEIDLRELFYVLLGNIYCIVLFLFYLVINVSAFVAWQRLRKN